MRKSWITIAPNGSHVTLNNGGFADSTFQHNQIIYNESMATSFPTVFHPYVDASVIKEAAEQPEPTVEEPKREILTEIPERDDVGLEVDKNKPKILEEVSAVDAKSETIVEVPKAKTTRKRRSAKLSK